MLFPSVPRQIRRELDIVLFLFHSWCMNWTLAVQLNQTALSRIIATLVAVLEDYAGAQWVPVYVHRMVTRILYPAESAVRRLIVIAAYKVTAKPAAEKARPTVKWPDGLVIARSAARKRRRSFRLFEPIAPLREPVPTHNPKRLPGIRLIEIDPRLPELFRRPPANQKPAAPQGFISIRNISARLAAVRFAIDNIPREAKRLMRTLDREKGEFKKLIIRPGPPPGRRKKPKEDIDHVLKECHDQREIGAGEGNRTLVFSLEGCCSTIELHPRFESCSVISCQKDCKRC
jgi:hypothetical protein